MYLISLFFIINYSEKRESNLDEEYICQKIKGFFLRIGIVIL